MNSDNIPSYALSMIHNLKLSDQTGKTSLSVRTNDTDVVVLAIIHSTKTKQQIYVSFGIGEKNHRYINDTDI